MKDKGLENRQRIVEAANELFYKRGYNQTSFSDIAAAADVPRGNFYYYFKSKDEILAAVVALRTDGIRAMLDEWERDIPDARDRIKRYARILLNREEDVLRYGCPMGSLTVELSKTQLVLQSEAAAMFTAFRDWLVRQFERLGHPELAQARAMHLLARTQGVSLMTNVYADREFLRQEVEAINDWVDSL